MFRTEVVAQEVVNFNGKHYFISTCNTMDHGLETMVFACDSAGNVSDWCELDLDRYDDHQEAVIGHKKMVNKYSLVN